jgi:colicin import membrane protein
MEKDLLSRRDTEDARVAGQVAEAEAKAEAAREAKKRAAEAMRRSIDAHIAHMKKSTLEGIRATQQEALADAAVFARKLALLDAQAAADAESARASAADAQRSNLAQMADKKRTAELWRAVDMTDARGADGAAKGGPGDRLFAENAAALEAAERAAGRSALPVQRLVRKLKEPPLMPNLRRM